MISKEKYVLNSLCEGELTFKEASEILKIPQDKIEVLLDEFRWLPSIEYMRQNYPELAE